MKNRRYAAFLTGWVGTVLLIVFFLIPAGRSQKSGIDRSMEYNDEGQLVSVEKTFDNGRLVEKKEFDLKTHTLRRRTTYKYLKGFKEADTSTTSYQSDGKTPQGTTNIDHDKDGNITSIVTTRYDAAGNETSGNKSERDPKTGTERCYNWNPSKQVYEEVECPKTTPTTDNAKVETGGGLIKVNFNVPGGNIIVNLPDDASGTISGTVIEEPKHKSPSDDDAFFMRQMYLDLLKREPGPGESQFWKSTVGDKGSTPPPVKFTVDIPQNQPIPIILRDKDGNPLGSITLPPIFVPPPSTGSAAPSSFQIPTLGQQGRPIEITGPFDGNSSNTKVEVLASGPSVTPIGGDWNGLVPLAESPRKVIVQSPSDVSGQMEIRVKEGTTETEGTFRNVGVNLTAPKTNLMKGERTQLSVTVEGLQGLTKPVPLTLTSQGVITMEGGPFQHFMIQPQQVDNAGNFTILRNVTGIQTGAWAATATVVTNPFDFCLQDENTPGNVLLVNSFTGDYFFKCPGCDFAPSKAFEIKDFSFGTDHLLLSLGPGFHGAGHPTIQDCRIKVQENNKDRKVWIEFDACGRSGSASLEQSQPQLKFTITDRNMRDNICAVPSSR